eukprot:IDg6261t1
MDEGEVSRNGDKYIASKLFASSRNCLGAPLMQTICVHNACGKIAFRTTNKSKGLAQFKGRIDRLRRLGVKFNASNLRLLAIDILRSSTSADYSLNQNDPLTDRPLLEKITSRWIQSFMDIFRIVSLAHNGKHILIPKKEEEIEVSVAVHLGTVCGLMSAGKLDENDTENAGETHFIVKVDNGRTLGFCGDQEVKYADAVIGVEGFTMLVQLSGVRDARIQPPFMWLNEKRVIKPLPNNRRRILYVDNCSGHVETEEMLSASANLNTVVRYFPPNATHLIQPCDSFVIQKIKAAWTTHWENFKLSKIRNGEWSNKSGNICNPGKKFYLRLASRCVREVNLQRDKDGLTCARNAMIITGLALNTNGRWEVGQLTLNYRKLFESTNKCLKYLVMRQCVQLMPTRQSKSRVSTHFFYW